MQRIVRFVVFAICWFAPGMALADTLDTFTLSGDGHTFQFSIPSTDTVSNVPHIVETSFSGAAGTVDNVSGYTFGATIATLDDGQVPLIMLTVDPLPPGITANPYFGPYYRLYGPDITSLIADVPDPDPLAPPSSDLLTFMYLPGDYLLTGYDPSQAFGDYTLDIAAAPANTAATPEPAPWLLLLTGVAAVAVLRSRGMHAKLD